MQIRFAHRLIDGGVDLVHGHSSHHPRPIEVYRKKLILYGCGDLVDDYEGIGSHRGYRDDLRLLYLPRLDPVSGELVELLDGASPSVLGCDCTEPPSGGCPVAFGGCLTR